MGIAPNPSTLCWEILKLCWIREPRRETGEHMTEKQAVPPIIWESKTVLYTYQQTFPLIKGNENWWKQQDAQPNVFFWNINEKVRCDPFLDEHPNPITLSEWGSRQILKLFHFWFLICGHHEMKQVSSIRRDLIMLTPNLRVPSWKPGKNTIVSQRVY